jgi:two-component system NtrC family sensor kinase
MRPGHINAFDDRLVGARLLPRRMRHGLEGVLKSLIGKEVRICDSQMTPQDRPVHYDLDAVAYVQCEDPAYANRVAMFIEQICQMNARYLMASRMHRKVVDIDYEELRRRNEALEQSRESYKALSENLEARVAEQVEQIDAAQRQVYLHERLSTVGQLAAGMAHEINNPLGYITNNLKVAGSYVDDLEAKVAALDDNQRREFADILEDFRSLTSECLEGALRISTIIGDLKRFSDIDQVSSTRDVEVCEIIESAIRMVAAVEPDVASRVQVEGGQGWVNGHSGHLSQAFFNVIHNACIACRQGGDIRITVAEDETHVVLVFADSGPGMDKETLSRAREPFFTTRPVGDGTGLGLSSAVDIVQAHNGSLDIDSVPGKGTQVVIHLPRVDA